MIRACHAHLSKTLSAKKKSYSCKTHRHFCFNMPTRQVAFFAFPCGSGQPLQFCEAMPSTIIHLDPTFSKDFLRNPSLCPGSASSEVQDLLGMNDHKDQQNKSKWESVWCTSGSFHINGYFTFFFTRSVYLENIDRKWSQIISRNPCWYNKTLYFNCFLALSMVLKSNTLNIH